MELIATEDMMITIKIITRTVINSTENVLLRALHILLKVTDIQVGADRVLRALTHEVGDDVDGYREDDGAVVLCRDAVESLEVSQLEV